MVFVYYFFSAELQINIILSVSEQEINQPEFIYGDTVIEIVENFAIEEPMFYGTAIRMHDNTLVSTSEAYMNFILNNYINI